MRGSTEEGKLYGETVCVWKRVWGIAFTGRIVLNGAKDHGPTWTRVAWNECVELIRL